MCLKTRADAVSRGIDLLDWPHLKHVSATIAYPHKDELSFAYMRAFLHGEVRFHSNRDELTGH